MSIRTSWPIRRLSKQACLLGRRGFSATAVRRANWAFIGLGQMGYQMAKNLHAKLPQGDTLYVHDILPEVMARFRDEVGGEGGGGAEVKVTGRVKDVGEDASTIITVLPEPSHVKNVFSQLLQPETTSPSSSSSSSSPSPSSPHPPPLEEKLFIDCSTIDPTSSREVARAVHVTQQGKFIDAPMSGGVVGAKAGTLTFMIGGTSTTSPLFPRITNILQKMGKTVLHCGEQGGSGLVGKLANNYLLAITNIATAEAMNLGIQSGLDAKVLANLINVSTGRCWPSSVNNPVKGVVEGAPAERDYMGGFGIGLMRKDLGLAILAAREVGAGLEMGARAMEVYEGAERDERCKGRDFSVVYRFLGGEEVR